MSYHIYVFIGLYILALPFVLIAGFKFFEFGIKFSVFMLANIMIISQFAVFLTQIISISIFKSLNEYRVILDNSKSRIFKLSYFILIYLIYAAIIIVEDKIDMQTIITVLVFLNLLWITPDYFASIVYLGDANILINKKIISFGNIDKVDIRTNKVGGKTILFELKNEKNITIYPKNEKQMDDIVYSLRSTIKDS